MSRLSHPAKWQPPGYTPGLRVWLRAELEGGGLLSPPGIHPAHDARRECLLLVHGFNNHAGEAASAYLGFRERQYASFPHLERPCLEERFGDVFWPGDADWPWLLDRLDFLVYPAAVGTARQGAALVAGAVLSLPNLERASFIGHSLGCRLVLETLEILVARGRPVIDRVCLMAAAVPREMLEPGGRFEQLLAALAASGARIRVLHSPKDKVLRAAFPPGQALAGEPSMHALGLGGPSHETVGGASLVSAHQVRSAGHGDYWGHNGRGEAAADAGAFLGLGAPLREIAARPCAEARALGVRRVI